MSDFKKYIGKYFKRKLSDSYTEGETYVFEIIDFNGKYFVVNGYGIYLGFSTLDLNLEMNTSFLTKEDFIEITKDEFDTIKYLCKDPYTTDWTDHEKEQSYYQTLINKGSSKIKYATMKYFD